MPPGASFNIMVRMPNWLGDCVMALPAVRHLADSLPRAKLFLAGREAFRELFLAQPGIAGFVPAPASGVGKLIRGLSATGRTLREAGLVDGVDLGLLFTNSLSSAIWLWRCGARIRMGYNRDGRRLFLTNPVPCGGVESSWHFVRYYLWLAQLAETAATATHAVSRRQVHPLGDYATPVLAVSETAREAAAVRLTAAGVTGRYAVIAPASAYGAVKDWPPDHYRRLVETITRELSLPVVATGGAGQAGVCEMIVDGQQAAVNLAGKTDLTVFTGLLAGASLFVGGDSGGAHAAAALGVPTVVIFGITNPTRTRALGSRVEAVGTGEERDVKLSTPEAREAAKRALAAITPALVMEAARKVIAS